MKDGTICCIENRLEDGTSQKVTSYANGQISLMNTIKHIWTILNCEIKKMSRNIFTKAFASCSECSLSYLL